MGLSEFWFSRFYFKERGFIFALSPPPPAGFVKCTLNAQISCLCDINKQREEISHFNYRELVHSYTLLTVCLLREISISSEGIRDNLAASEPLVCVVILQRLSRFCQDTG